MSKVYIADREVHSIAELSKKWSARLTRKKSAWHAPYPPRPEPAPRKPVTEIKGSNVEK